MFFEIKSGVRQGGLASALFFIVYVDDLLWELDNEGLGCYFGDMWLGALMYADDLILISGSVKQLQHMLDKCTNFGGKMDLTFNAKKSCYFCTDHNVKLNLQLNEHELPCAGLSFMYLGVELGIKQRKLCIVPDKRVRKFTGAAMNVIRNSESLPMNVR